MCACNILSGFSILSDRLHTLFREVFIFGSDLSSFLLCTLDVVVLTFTTFPQPLCDGPIGLAWLILAVIRSKIPSAVVQSEQLRFICHRRLLHMKLLSIIVIARATKRHFLAGSFGHIRSLFYPNVLTILSTILLGFSVIVKPYDRCHLFCRSFRI